MRKKKQHACVLGLGRSGRAATQLLLREGWKVTVLDANRNEALENDALFLKKKGATVNLAATALPDRHLDLAVVSPGISCDAPWVRALLEKGVPVIGELELGFRHCRSRILAVTGSNGKSTLVKYLAETLQHQDIRTVAAGNYGRPLCEVVLEEPDLAWVVLEVSSFQLETVDRFRPDIGILLNVYPNHLDRHGDMDTYLEVKSRLFARMTSDDHAVVPIDLHEKVREITSGDPAWVTFGLDESADYFWHTPQVVRRGIGIGSFKNTVFCNDILGPHMAAGLAALDELGARRTLAERMAEAFISLRHRMQEVGDACNIRFINDSKATNFKALEAAVLSAGGPVRLIAGGIAKEKDLSGPKEVLAHRAAGVYLMGQAAESLHAAWQSVAPCEVFETLEEAFGAAWRDAEPGEVILLSPGCTSFDQYRSFDERGDAFIELVESLLTEEETWKKEEEAVRT